MADEEKSLCDLERTYVASFVVVARLSADRRDRHRARRYFGHLQSLRRRTDPAAGFSGYIGGSLGVQEALEDAGLDVLRRSIRIRNVCKDIWNLNTLDARYYHDGNDLRRGGHVANEKGTDATINVSFVERRNNSDVRWDAASLTMTKVGHQVDYR